ncbi:YjcG family protein [Mammaliicoccus sciuri]|uniref:YjcG family protein n=1 Tax=Mammaliicoccus sciuri TaxID=1296 RepID=UPI001FB48685|nr:YjcG family protein [Mammaliicoccus sciuri]MCJ1777954.1 YjcG family protein [Mammaliicoccus sciuri]
MKLGIVLIPSKPFQEQVNAYRKRYDKHYALIAPHITIKEKFEIEDSKLNEVKSQLEATAKEFEPVNIQVSKASSFAPTKNVIYFKVTKTDELESLFSKFNNEAFYGESTHPFVPHFTIAQGLSSQEFEDIYGQVRMAGIDHSETIDTIKLMKQNEDETWSEEASYTLG